ncbi:MAG: phosphoribosyltransferase [Candidatus Aenigmarchaeota archaeon]|nr:phosphoribosyltransferase [Candidatus Aenigmarchaeota archaeon]
MLEDRRQAGRLLAERLEKYSGKDPLVLALPRGGAAVAAEIVDIIGGRLGLIISRKIGAPRNPELAIGAVAPDRSVILDKKMVKETGATAEYLKREARIEAIEIDRRKNIYGSDLKGEDAAGKIVILVDDGIATGHTMRSAVRFLKKMRPKKIIVAVPVLPGESVKDFRAEVDELVYLDAPDDFGAIGAHYKKFPQLTDGEVVRFLKGQKT